jgi:predicted short-subunit dehydrogenase-like oxidoreductase (DUF2520 family)
LAENVAIVGAGRMGLALGGALHRAGEVERLVYYGRGMEPPPHPLFDGADAAEYRLGPTIIADGTTILLLAVPDGVLGEVAYDYAAAGTAPRGCAALHLAGALSTDVLAPLHGAGYAVGSLHPLQAVADRWQSGERLVGAAFALAGDPAAIAAGRRLASALGGTSFVIPPHLRPVYHAAAVTASNYLVALLSAATRMLARAGLGEEDAFRALLPLVRGTVENIEQLGLSTALTGPIARGDVDTVRLHLARLSDEERSLYCPLGLELLSLARAAGLDEQRAEQLEALLSSG